MSYMHTCINHIVEYRIHSSRFIIESGAIIMDYSTIYYYAWLCPFVCSFVCVCVRTCEKRKRKPHARAPGCTFDLACDQFTVTGQSTTCLYVKCEKMLALSSDYKT